MRKQWDQMGEEDIDDDGGAPGVGAEVIGLDPPNKPSQLDLILSRDTVGASAQAFANQSRVRYSMVCNRRRPQILFVRGSSPASPAMVDRH